jgi:Rho-binding antiterminator
MITSTMSYQPISCNFYDELEALATLRKNCQILYRDEKEQQAVINGIIKDLYIREKAEYLLLDNGTEIRLDQLISVDGKALKGYC